MINAISLFEFVCMKYFGLITLLGALLSSCSNHYTPTENTAKDINGIISIASTSYDTLNNWQKHRYYTGEGMRQYKINDGPSFIDYSVYIENPSEYKLYILATTMQSTAQKGQFGVTAKERTSEEYNQKKEDIKHYPSIDIKLAKKVDDFSLVEKISFNTSINPQSWLSQSSFNKGESAVINFPSKGTYCIRVEMPLDAKTYFDKIVLTSNDFIPSGTGPNDTNIADKDIYFSGIDSLVVIPPHWAFGVLYGGYTDQKQSIVLIDKLIEEDYPIDAYWIDSWFWDYSNRGKGPKGYMNFKEDKIAFPDIEYMWNYFKKHSIKSGIWVWDCILREGNEEMYDSFKKNKLFSSRVIETNRWHNKTGETICGNIDFDNPDAVKYWTKQLEPFFDKGLDFLKLDRSSEISFCKTAFEATQTLGKETNGRGFIMSHLHTTFDKRHKSYPTKWTGDAKITWTQDNYPNLGIYAMGGYKENIAMIADPKRSTYEPPFLTHDAGGYDYFRDGEQSDELYARWIQFSSMNSVMTIFSQHYNETRNHPYNYPKPIQNIVRKYLKLRMQLFPYIYTYALNTRLTGNKMVQGDGINEQQYFFGNEFLVAPIYVQGANTRDLYLPEGRWYDFDSDKVYEGSKNITVDAPLSKMPIFVKEGAIIPMREYARSIEQGTNKKIYLHFYPTQGQGSFTLLEDDGNSNEYLNGVFSKTLITADYSDTNINIVINARENSYRGAFDNRDWTLIIHSSKKANNITINGVEINDYRYYIEESLLEIDLPTCPTNKSIYIDIKNSHNEKNI